MGPEDSEKYSKLVVQRLNQFFLFSKTWYFRMFLVFVIPQLLLALSIIFKAGEHTLYSIYFVRFLIEGMLAFAAAAALLVFPDKLYRILFFLYYGTYVAAIVAQLISYDSTYAFIPKMALQNIENTHLFFNFKNKVIMFFGVMVSVVGSSWILHSSMHKERKSLKVIAALFLVFMAGIFLDKAAVGKIYTLRSKNPEKELLSGLYDYSPPVRALFSTAINSAKATLAKQEDIDRVMNSGLVSRSISYFSFFPLIKKFIYKTPPPFAKIKGTRPKQNIVIIFTEGLSARTINAYDESFENLTPNLKDFSREEGSMIVKNYFNHTAPTFTGLRGQLCSLYAKNFPHEEWRTKKNRAAYFCLAHLLRNSGYDSSFLDPHFKKRDYLNDMLEHLGFDRVLTAEDIIKYVDKDWGGPTNLPLTNRDLYEGLYNFVVEKQQQNKPFFIATYPFETHAWIDTGVSGAKYLSGKNNALNTIHEMDIQFGKFWKRFKKLEAYKNTVVIFTTDHAHYHEDSYLRAMFDVGAKDYRPYFYDRVPLIIHDPTRKLPKVFDAHYSTSLHLAPTIVHFMGLPNQENPFMGMSLFERNLREDIATHGNFFYRINESGVVPISDSENADDIAIMSIIKSSRNFERDKRVWPNF